MMTNWYDRTGQMIDVKTTGALLSKPGYKRVALSRVISASDPEVKYDVSTVWLGLSHQFGEGPPLIFETMVFGSDGDWADLLCQRYATEEEALAGHAEIVTTVRATVPDEIVVDD